MYRTSDSKEKLDGIVYGSAESIYRCGFVLRHRLETAAARRFSEEHRRAFVMGALIAMGSQEALAGNNDINTPFANVSNAMCTIANNLRGPIGIIAVLIMIIIAGISLAVGGKRSTSTLISALVGAGVILGARGFVVILGGENFVNRCQLQNGAQQAN